MAVETRRTTCNRDCPDACSILVDVDAETNRAVRLRGDPDHPVTNGFLCLRTNRFLERQYSPERLLTPLVHGAPASWDEALDFVAGKLEKIKRESGAAAVLHYRSGGSLGLLKPLADFFFESWGPTTIHRGDICSGGGEAAQRADFGDCDANDVFDLEHARTIVLWGKNPYISSPHLLPILKAARARGTTIVLVDPVRHRSADLADLFLQNRPASDDAVALGVARLLFESGRTDPAAASYVEDLDAFRRLAFSRSVEAWAALADLSAADLARFADAYAKGPSAILVGWGMARRGNGAAIVRAVDALATITGNMGRKGGGAGYYWRRRAAFDLSFIKGAAVAPRTIPEPLLGPGILEAKDPALRAVWVTCGNPVAMLPESETVARALATRELTVVVDAFLTDTARLATVVLPTTTLLEDDDLLGAYGHHYLGVARPVVARPPGIKTDLEVLKALGARLGVTALDGDARSWKRRLLAPLEREHGVTLEAIEQGYVRNPRAKPVLFEGNRFSTPSGRASLLASLPATPPPDPEFPLHFLSLSTDKAQAAQTSSQVQAGPLEATVHPDAALGRPDGARAWLASRIGRIEVVLRHDALQRKDVVVVPKGGWHQRGRSANALIRAKATDLGEGAAYHDEPVRLE